MKKAQLKQIKKETTQFLSDLEAVNNTKQSRHITFIQIICVKIYRKKWLFTLFVSIIYTNCVICYITKRFQKWDWHNLLFSWYILFIFVYFSSLTEKEIKGGFTKKNCYRLNNKKFRWTGYIILFHYYE